MTRKKQDPNRVDALLDELLEEHQSPEEILGESGLLKQLSKRLIERALAGELKAHLKEQAEAGQNNSRNGHSKKTVQSNHGEMELSIPRDRQGSFERLCCMKEKCKMVLYCKGEKMGDKYRVKNWSEYDAGLKQRGSLTFWVNEEVLKSWLEEEKTGKQGASPKYSDQAIITMMTIKRVMGLARRQTEGFVESLFMLMGVDLPVPDHTTVSRRLGKLEIELPVKPSTKARHVVVDSTGIKIYGEGEWKTRQHGVSKRRTWRKLHLAIDESTGEILEAEVTTNDYGDCEILEGLLEEIEGEIEQVSGDGGYDTFDCHEAIQKKGAKAAIPPQKNAVPTHKRGEPAEHPRDKILQRIEILGRKGWKEESEYHRRSKAENTMFRLKTIFGGKISSREFENQAVELFIQCAALNRMIQIASPVSFKVL